MTIPSERDVAALRAELAKLRQTLDQLNEMAGQGLAVGEAQAETRRRIADLEAQVGAVDAVAGAPETRSFDQQAQQVQRQVNVARDYIDQRRIVFEPGVDPDPETLRRAYLSRLMQECERLPLRGVDPDAADPSRARQQRLGLAQVYVALDTTTQVPERFVQALGAGRAPPDLDGVWCGSPAELARDEKQAPLSALNATIAYRRLVILGDPGSGKSTFVSYVTLCLAGAALEPGAGWGERLPCWPPGESGLLPLPVVLRDFAGWLGRRSSDAGETRRGPAVVGLYRPLAGGRRAGGVRPFVAPGPARRPCPGVAGRPG